jgi:hypothetical protein
VSMVDSLVNCWGSREGKFKVLPRLPLFWEARDCVLFLFSYMVDSCRTV